MTTKIEEIMAKVLDEVYGESALHPEVVKGQMDALDAAGLAVLPKLDACEHQWDGPYIDIENGTSITCSKCGLDAFTHSLRQGW